MLMDQKIFFRLWPSLSDSLPVLVPYHSRLLTRCSRSWHDDPDVDTLLRTRDDLLGPDEEIIPNDNLNGTAFEREGHCTGIYPGTRAYNLGVSIEQSTQVAAPSAQGKGHVGDLADGVKMRQAAVRVRGNINLTSYAIRSYSP